MTTIKARDYANRSDLEAHIRNSYGDDISANRAADIVIPGTADERKALNLLENTNVFGVQCTIV